MALSGPNRIRRRESAFGTQSGHARRPPPCVNCAVRVFSRAKKKAPASNGAFSYAITQALPTRKLSGIWQDRAGRFGSTQYCCSRFQRGIGFGRSTENITF